jgi:hypothetical protein
MARENSMTPTYEILAVITRHKDQLLASGKALAYYAESEDIQKQMTTDIAKALKADITQLSNGDYLVLRL